MLVSLPTSHFRCQRLCRYESVVVITDIIHRTSSNILISGSSGPTLQGPRRVNGDGGHMSLTTPWVLPVGSDLFVTSTFSSNPTVTLIGRVQNL